jgi:hypothetical protein
MASKAIEGEQSGGKYLAEKKPVKTKAEKKPMMEGNKKKLFSYYYRKNSRYAFLFSTCL